MPDRFELATKALLDAFPLGTTERVHNGGRVSFGYKPDRVYRKRHTTWIVEMESSTSRKGYLGGYLKAQKYIHDHCSGHGSLLFLINEIRCESQTIKNQLQHYHDWLTDMGVPVQPTYLLYAKELKESLAQGIQLFSGEFLRCAKVVR